MTAWFAEQLVHLPLIRTWPVPDIVERKNAPSCSFLMILYGFFAVISPRWWIWNCERTGHVWLSLSHWRWSCFPEWVIRVVVWSPNTCMSCCLFGFWFMGGLGNLA